MSRKCEQSQNPPTRLLYQGNSKNCLDKNAQIRRQVSALQPSRFDQNLKFVENFMFKIKPPF